MWLSLLVLAAFLSTQAFAERSAARSCDTKAEREQLVRAYLNFESCDKDYRADLCPYAFVLGTNLSNKQLGRLKHNEAELDRAGHRRAIREKRTLGVKPGTYVRYRDPATGILHFAEVTKDNFPYSTAVLDPRFGARNVQRQTVEGLSEITPAEYDRQILPLLLKGSSVKFRSGAEGIIGKITTTGFEVIRDETSNRAQKKIIDKIPWSKAGELIVKITPKSTHKLGASGLLLATRLSTATAGGLPAVVTSAMVMAIEPTDVSCGELSASVLKFPPGTCESTEAIAASDEFRAMSFSDQVKALQNPVVCRDFSRALEKREERFQEELFGEKYLDEAAKCTNTPSTDIGYGDTPIFFTGSKGYLRNIIVGGAEYASERPIYYFTYDKTGLLTGGKMKINPDLGVPETDQFVPLDIKKEAVRKAARKAFVTVRLNHKVCSLAPVLAEPVELESARN